MSCWTPCPGVCAVRLPARRRGGRCPPVGEAMVGLVSCYGRTIASANPRDRSPVGACRCWQWIFCRVVLVEFRSGVCPSVATATGTGERSRTVEPAFCPRGDCCAPGELLATRLSVAPSCGRWCRGVRSSRRRIALQPGTMDYSEIGIELQPRNAMFNNHITNRQTCTKNARGRSMANLTQPYTCTCTRG